MDDDIRTVFSGAGPVREVNFDVLTRLRAFFRRRMDTLLETSTRRHPLGFFYAVEKLDDSATLRYHLWPENWSVPPDQMNGEIHDHIFELNSVVLSGAMRHETFSFVPSNKGNREILRVVYSGETSKLRRSGERGELKDISNEIYQPGTVYRVPAGTIHRAEALKSPAATLVLAISESNPPDPRVIIEYGHSIPPGFSRTKLQGADLLSARSILAHL